MSACVPSSLASNVSISKTVGFAVDFFAMALNTRIAVARFLVSCT